MGKGKRCKSVRRASENNRGNVTVQDKSIANSLFRRKMFWAVMALVLLAIPATIFLYSKLSVSNDLFEAKSVSLQNSFSQSPLIGLPQEAKPVSPQNSSSQLPLVGLPKENKSAFAKPTDISTETTFYRLLNYKTL